jgi:mRNA interferase YafQ
MYRIITSPKFKRSYKKFINKYPFTTEKLQDILYILSENPYSPLLSIHKLSGALLGLYACKCGFDCRIVFSFEKMPDTNEDVLMLIDIGTHDDVY